MYRDSRQPQSAEEDEEDEEEGVVSRLAAGNETAAHIANRCPGTPSCSAGMTGTAMWPGSLSAAAQDGDSQRPTEACGSSSCHFKVPDKNSDRL
jgi:hypothetical protein